MEYQNIYIEAGKDFYNNGEGIAVASPTLELDLFACRVCLATDIKLFDIHECDLAENFETVMGLPVPPDDGLPQHLCHYCFSQLQKYATFREKCKHSLDILETAVLLGQPLTTDYVRVIDRDAEGLALPLTMHDTIIDYEIITDIEAPIPMEGYTDVKEEVVYEENLEGNQVYEVMEHDYMAQEVQEAVESVLEEHPTERKPKKPKTDRVKCFRVAEHPMIEMVTLNKAQQIQEMRNRQHSTSYLAALHKCDKCFKGFHNGIAFRNHMAMHNPTNGPIECDVCEMRFVNDAKMRVHLANVHERRFLCRQCSHVSCTSHRAIEHQKFHEGKTFDCQYCGEKFEKSSALMSHIRSDHPNEYQQRAVNSRPSSRPSGNYKRGPNIETWISCDDCHVDFNGATAFSRHMTTATRHNDDGAQNFFFCKQCGESFETDVQLQDHKIVHVGCEEPTSKPRSARRDGYSEEDKPYACQYCGKQFKFPQYLQIHVRTHTGERPYVCNICAMAFQAKANLNRHFKVHTGDKPYMCDLCGRSFTQSNSMKLHVKTVHLKMPDPYRDRRKFYRNRRKDSPTNMVEAEEQDE